jgi:hypothetical protein
MTRLCALSIWLQTLEDSNQEQIYFLSFGVDSWYAQWGLLGMARIQRTAQEILNYRKSGVKDLENAQIYLLNFEINEVISFVQAHQPWAPGGLACLYHTLVHEFGREAVENEIKVRSTPH